MLKQHDKIIVLLLFVTISLFSFSCFIELNSKDTVKLPSLFTPLNFDEIKALKDNLLNKIENVGVVDYYYSSWHDIGSVIIRIVYNKKNNKIKLIDIQPSDIRRECIYCSKNGYPSWCRQIDYQYNKRLFNKIYLKLKKEIGEYNTSSSVNHYDCQESDPREKNYLWENEGLLIRLSLMRILNQGCGFAWFVNLSAENKM